MAEVETQVPSAGTAVETVAPPTTTEVDELETVQPVDGQLAETQETQSTEAEVEEQEPDLEEVPETSGDFQKYKPLFKENPELRAILGREKAYSEIAPSFSEFKGIMERVPTLDDAEKLANDAQNLHSLGETFRNDQEGFVESLKESDPFAFQQFAKRLPEILASTDPTLYREQSVFYTNGTLDNLFARAQASGNQDAIVSVQNVAALLGMQLGMQRTAPNTDNSETARLRKQLAERDQADTQARASSFWDGAVEEHYTTSVSEIESLIKKSIPDVNPAQLKRMGAEVWEGVNSRLASQPQTLAQLERFKSDVSKGKMGQSDRKAIVDFSMRRTKQLIPLVWKEVSAEWSKEILRLNKEQIDKRKAIAGKTKEVAAPTGGTPAAAAPARTAAPAKAGGIKGILHRLSSGTYQAPARP